VLARWRKIPEPSCSCGAAKQTMRQSSGWACSTNDKKTFCWLSFNPQAIAVSAAFGAPGPAALMGSLSRCQRRHMGTLRRQNFVRGEANKPETKIILQ